MTSTTRQQFDKHGYVVLKEFLWPAECDEIRQEAVEIAEALSKDEANRIVFSTKDETQLKNDFFIESNDKIRAFFEDGALDMEGNLNVAPHLAVNKIGHALHLLNSTFRCYTYCHRVKSLCSELGLIKPAVAQSMVIFKNPGVGGEVVAHQDATYLHTEPIPPIGFWIALEDATIENGCLWIAGGSHKSGVHRRLIRNPDKDSEEKLIYDKPAAVYPSSSFTSVPVKKGSCIVLHGHVVHKSEMNKSNQSRPAYTFHVIEKKNNNYSPDNWLQEGEGAPFRNLYKTLQLM